MPHDANRDPNGFVKTLSMPESPHQFEDLTPDSINLEPREVFSREGPTDYRQLESTFKGLIDNPDSTETLRRGYHFLYFACQMVLKPSSDRPFEPVMVWHGEEGVPTRSTPGPENWSEQSYLAIETTARLIENRALHARLCDLISLQVKAPRLKAELAKSAADSYLDLLQLGSPSDDWKVALILATYARRCLQLASKYNATKVMLGVQNWLRDKVLNGNLDDNEFLKIIQAVREGQNKKVPEALPYLEKLASTLTRDGRFYRARQCLEEAATNSSQSEAFQYYRQIATLFETESTKKDGAILKVKWLNDALTYLRRAGNQASEIERIHRKILELQEGLRSELLYFEESIPFDLGPWLDKIEAIKDFPASLGFVASELIDSLPTKEDCIEAARARLNDSPLTALMPTQYINLEGRQILKTPGNPEDRLKVETFKLATMQMGFAAECLLRPLLERAYLNHRPELQDVYSFLTGRSPKGQNMQWSKALWLGLKGEYDQAGPLIAPLIENFLRSLAYSKGAIVSGLDDDGVQDAFTLEKLLRQEAQLLENLLGKNLFFTLTAAFYRSGWNYRNRSAHGLLTDKEASGAESVFMLGLGLLLMVLDRPQTQ